MPCNEKTPLSCPRGYWLWPVVDGGCAGGTVTAGGAVLGAMPVVAGGLASSRAVLVPRRRRTRAPEDNDEHAACDPSPQGGGAHPALHLHLALHVHSSIEISGVRHGDLPSLMSVETTPGHAPGSRPWNSYGPQGAASGPLRDGCGENPTAGGAGHALLSFASKISWVCVTMAASLPSPRVMRVSSTMVVRPRCSGMQTARAVSPFGTAAKKLVLLSMVAVRPPSEG